MKKQTLKQSLCSNFYWSHNFSENLTYDSFFLEYSKEFRVRLYGYCSYCGKETLIEVFYMHPTEYVRFNSKHLFDKFVETHEKEHVWDITVISEGIKKERRVRKV